MVESLFEQLFAILIIAIILASLAGSLPHLVQYFMSISGYVFGGAIIGITLIIVAKK
jgi:hypothetical protein